MKTLKLRMLVAALMLITAGFFAGCKANIATPVSPDSFALNADEYVDSDDPFEVMNITTEKYAGKDEYIVKVIFNHDVNKEGVKNGVKFYKLEDAAGQKSWEMPAMTEIESTDLKIADKTAYFTIPAKDLNLYVYVKASETKAINGIKLNQDKDEIWGEEGDDDYAYFEDLGTAPALTGNKNHNKKIGGLNDTLTLLTFGNPSFHSGTGAEAYLVKKVEINAMNFLNIYINGLNNGDLSEAAKTAKIGEATDIFNKHLKLKQFNWKENKWENIDLSFIYDNTNKKWVSDVTVEKNRSLAFQWENINDIKMTFVKYAYPLRFTLKNDDPILSDNIAEAESGPLSLVEGDIWPDFNKLTINKFFFGKVEITLSAAGVNFPFYIENHWFDATEDNKDGPANPSLFAGFNPETIVKENFKCTRIVGGKEVLIPIRKVTPIQTNVSTYPYALNTIVIELAENVQAGTVYISPSVRSAAFEGSYNDGGLKGIRIPELCFTNIKSSDNPYTWKGWLKK